VKAVIDSFKQLQDLNYFYVKVNSL